MKTLTVKVTDKADEALDIVRIELASVDGTPLPPFSAGAHVDVHLPQGIVRQYSLCNDSEESHRYMIAVLRDPASRGGSVAMHDAVQQGDVLQISEPKNHSPLATAQRSLLFAGGIGVTPIVCMAERLARIGADFEMHYCTRSTERTAFRKRIATSQFADRVHYYFDSGESEQKLDAMALLTDACPNVHLYVCGPSGFIDHIVNTAKACGWPEDRIHLEYFGAKPQDRSHDGGFEVVLASTGKSYSIAADKTVVEVLAEHNIEILTSCEQGVCGTCITRIIEGIPDHRDVYFSASEHAKNDQFTPCCSRAKSARLVIDL